MVLEPRSWHLAALPPMLLPSTAQPSLVADPTCADLAVDSAIITLYHKSHICYYRSNTKTSTVNLQGSARPPQSKIIRPGLNVFRLNQDARRTKVTTRLVAPRPSAPSAASRPYQPKKLTREELRDRSAKGLCWHYDEP
ncbi:hypothetical protein B296_00031022 [Ensete ventricosum]|uniref:Uncharacterized protein n=1 Tax=Ensete ventricosum TaxID=4639 RepID=A0A426XK04_ENSVE|nr:hypothetical protein B296_00031022 [Ensete ventricosum]